MGSEARPTRFYLLAGTLLFLLAVIPISVSSEIRGTFFSFFEGPLRFSGQVAQTAGDLFYFHRNAEENRDWRRQFSDQKLSQIQAHEIRLENERLVKLLELKPLAGRGAYRVFYARVVVRSPLAWNRTLWIDKGFEDGIRENMPVFAGENLAGKIIEVKPGASKSVLITDPNCKVGVMIHRTRQQGILYGVISGECRMKYLPVDADVKPGDRVETAGLGVFFPKGVPVGDVTKVWKEPGQIYLTAAIKPLADLGKLEEVAVPDVR